MRRRPSGGRIGRRTSRPRPRGRAGRPASTRTSAPGGARGRQLRSTWQRARPTKLPATIARRRDRAQHSNPGKSGLQIRDGIRRSGLRPFSRRSADGLSKRVVSPRRRDETSRRKAATPRVCAEKKQARRAVIIAKGYGGLNGATDYRRHKKCRS